MNLLISFNRLQQKYGMQNWWPLYCPATKTFEYTGKSALSENEALEIALGAILTQNTSWKNAEKALLAMHTKNVVSTKSLQKTRLSSLAKTIKPARFQNSKAGYVKNFVRHAARHYNGSLMKFYSKPLPELRKELLSIKGIGKETADSIILYSAQKPVFVVDNYAKRFAKEMNWSVNGDYDSLQRFFECGLPRDILTYKEFHALIVKHMQVLDALTGKRC